MGQFSSKAKKMEVLSHRGFRVPRSEVKGWKVVFPGQRILRRDSTLVHTEGFGLANPPARPLGFCLLDFPVWKFAEMHLAPVSAGIKTPQRSCYHLSEAWKGEGSLLKKLSFLGI